MKPKQPKKRDPKPNEVSGKVKEVQRPTYTSNNLFNTYYKRMRDEYYIEFSEDAIIEVYDKFIKDAKD